MTTLITRKAHHDTLHGGIQMFLAHIRNQYWIMKGRQTVKKDISSCMMCFKFMQQTNDQFMGCLSKERITASKPFMFIGFIGFICFSSKAIHFELVTDLSSDSFVAAIRRFIARRGHWSHIY